jgi:hypothetical protein
MVRSLLNYIEYAEVKGAHFPRNLEFYSVVDNPEFRQPGIFNLYYRGELIYIGFTNNKQDVIAERVVRQIATITLRDHRIQFSSTAAKIFKQEPVFNAHINITELVIANDDFQTSGNRVKYAAYHWDEFLNLNKATLDRFEFEWFPKPSLGKHPDIEALCNQLKNRYAPRCNREYSNLKL